MIDAEPEAIARHSLTSISEVRLRERQSFYSSEPRLLDVGGPPAERAHRPTGQVARLVEPASEVGLAPNGYKRPEPDRQLTSEHRPCARGHAEGAVAPVEQDLARSVVVGLGEQGPQIVTEPVADDRVGNEHQWEPRLLHPPAEVHVLVEADFAAEAAHRLEHVPPHTEGASDTEGQVTEDIEETVVLEGVPAEGRPPVVQADVDSRRHELVHPECRGHGLYVAGGDLVVRVEEADRPTPGGPGPFVACECPHGLP